LPTFLAKKQVYLWLKEGKKTIDVRKGDAKPGNSAVFICGPYRLEMKVLGTQTGRLEEVIREDNFRQVIPLAASLGDALGYLRGIYGCCDGVFTAYSVSLG
jgi:ASC-1-like (ASCH) protein